MGFSLQAALVALLQTSRLQAHNYQSELVSGNILSTNRNAAIVVLSSFINGMKKYDRTKMSQNEKLFKNGVIFSLASSGS
jgi:hypothetical protein